MKKSRSIKWVLTSSFLLALIFPLCIAGFLLIKVTADSLKEEILLRNRQLSVKLNEQIEEHLNHSIITLRTFGKLLKSNLISKEQIDGHISNIVETHHDFYKIQLTDTDGIVKNVAPFDREYIDIDVSNQNLFKVPDKTGKTYWSSTFISLQLDRPVVSVSVPYDEGVITGFISLAGITDMVKSTITGKHSYITITDQAGIFIQHPDSKKVAQRVFDPNYSFFTKERNKEIRVHKIEMDGKDLMAFAGDIKKTDWLVVVYESVDDLFLPVKRMYTLSLICIIVIVSLVTYLSKKHVRTIMNEINRFRDTAQIISDGNYNERISGINYREFSELAQQFNKMAVSVEEREKSIRENEVKFRQILDSVGVGIFMVDPVTYLVTYVNPEAAKIVRKTRDEIIGSRCMDIVCNRQASECPVLNNREKIDVSERVFSTGDGEFIPVLKTATIASLGDEETIIESFIDLSKQKKMEDEKQKLEQQLQQVQKLETIGTLAGGIAHDFNNILSPIIGYSEIARVEVNPESSIHSYIDEIFQAAIRAKDLVKQILTFSRQSKKELKTLSIKPILMEVLKLVRSTLPTSIEIKHDIKKTGLIKADPTQIHQIIMNLVTNAFHAMEKDGGTLTISLKEVVLDSTDLIDSTMNIGKYISLNINDTGVGMDKATLGRIFEPYFSTKETGKGTGLGLSVVHGIIKGYGGSIKAYAEPLKGSSFNVLLPVFEDGVADSKIYSKADIVGGDERVLIVDDDPHILNMIQQILESLGYKVTARISSVVALNDFRLAPNDYDFVITDMTMPKMNGLQLSEELLRIKPDLPILICSGFSEQLTTENINQTGVKAMIMKPVVTSEIASAIRKILA